MSTTSVPVASKPREKKPAEGSVESAHPIDDVLSAGNQPEKLLVKVAALEVEHAVPILLQQAHVPGSQELVNLWVLKLQDSPSFDDHIEAAIPVAHVSVGIDFPCLPPTALGR